MSSPVTPFDITWSHSSLNMFLECPHKYYRVRIAKEFPFVETDAIREGNKIHQDIELHLLARKRGGNHSWNKGYEWLQEYASMAYDLPNLDTEKELALTAKLEHCAWFSRTQTVWGRCKIDVLSLDGDTAHVLDWKTGKYWGPDQQDIRTAMFLFWYYPELQVVNTNWVYMKPGKDEKKNTFTRAEHFMPAVGNTFRTLTAIAKATNDKDWVKTPGKGCRFCDVLDCAYKGKKL